MGRVVSKVSEARFMLSAFLARNPTREYSQERAVVAC